MNPAVIHAKAQMHQNESNTVSTSSLGTSNEFSRVDNFQNRSEPTW